MRQHTLTGILIATLLIPSLVAARVTRIEIDRHELFAGGMPFGSTGAYEKLVGTAFFAVDPEDPANAIVFDLDQVPTNPAGDVEFSTDILVLKPVDMDRGNGKIFFEVNNRGDAISFPLMNDTVVFPVNDPSTAEAAGNGFLFRQGYTMVWAGWEGDVKPGNDRFTIQLPIPTSDGTAAGDPITERILVEFHDRVFAGETPTTKPLSGGPSFGEDFISYEAVSTDQVVAEAELHVRPSDSFRPGRAAIPEGTVVPTSEWSFAFCPDGPPGTASTTDICLFDGFRNDRVYQLVYRAKNPRRSRGSARAAPTTCCRWCSLSTSWG